ncbi:hypothetical protein DMP07_03680 [Slackia faecicanis]|uniref:Uncharacterized protein n=1 Tax=Slackia faecicanis TaxID=255723 RepID=A0A3N0AFY4_9ACTN|nr:hypothetical protein DMP07_03680 [Slackia faecicanis]
MPSARNAAGGIRCSIRVSPARQARSQNDRSDQKAKRRTCQREKAGERLREAFPFVETPVCKRHENAADASVRTKSPDAMPRPFFSHRFSKDTRLA